MDSSALEKQLDRLLPLVLKLDPATRVAYGEGREGQLDHYRRLADKLLQQFGDESLALAGFLHGVGKDFRTTFEGRVSAEVLGILNGWEALAELAPKVRRTDRVFSDEFEKAVFGVEDVRSAVLLVLEALDRLDPTGRLSRWNAEFRQAPAPWVPPEGHPASEKELASIEGFGRVAPLLAIERMVAPAARAWGLWQEHTALRDGILWLREPERFEEVIGLVVGAKDWSLRRESKLRQELTESAGLGKSIKEIFWEWRHVTAISEQLATIPYDQWGSRLDRCGFVTVVCRDGASCYRVLERIHRKLDYRPELFRDSVGEPRRSGYRALHTGILDPCQVAGDRGTLTVRMIPVAAIPERFQPVESLHLNRLGRQLGSWKKEEIQVFHGRGEPRYVRVGTTVLELAATLVPQDLPMVIGAVIHRQLVDRFRVLQVGDIIEFRKGKPQALPEDWKQKVNEASIERIEKALQEGYGPVLEASAREWLREVLGRVLIDDTSLEVFFGMALTQELPTQEAAKHDTTWWLREIGIVNRRLRGEPVLRDSTVPEEQAQRLVQATRTAFQRLQTEVPLLSKDPGSLEEVWVCPKCRPSRRSLLVFTEIDRRLEIHREGETCARGAERVVWQSITAGQSLYVVMPDRAGALKQVLSAFSLFGLNIRETVVRALGPETSVARFDIPPTSPRVIHQVEQQIGQMESVRVYGPNDQVPSLIRQAFPPKSDPSEWLLSRFPEPFVCGPVVRKEYHFYGRISEMRQLLELVRAARESDSTGEMAFVSAPLKAGKTSMVQRFQKRLTLDPEHLDVCLYHTTGRHDTWLEVERKLEAKLATRLEELRLFWGFEDPGKLEGSLLDRIGHLRDSVDPQPTFVLAIDEVVRLFEQCVADSEAMEQLESFCARVRESPGVVVVWIGPAAPVYRLKPPLRRILEKDSQPIALHPLGISETTEMLRAAKLQIFHEIEASSGVIHEVHRQTGGDAFWTAQLGQEMWRLATAEQPGRKVRFNRALIERAAEEVVFSSTPLKARLFPSGIDEARERLMARVLCVLARLDRGPARAASRSGGVVPAEIRGRLGERQTEMEIRRQLEELASRGGVQRVKGDTWRIAVPLVRRYVEVLEEEIGLEDWGEGTS